MLVPPVWLPRRGLGCPPQRAGTALSHTVYQVGACLTRVRLDVDHGCDERLALSLQAPIVRGQRTLKARCIALC